MVEKLNAGRGSYQWILDKKGLGKDSDFRLIKFKPDSRRKEISLAKLAEMPPEFPTFIN